MRIPNGMPMYLINNLAKYFDPVFCRAFEKTLYFIGASNHLKIFVKFNSNSLLHFDDKWDYTYAFKCEDIKRNTEWFSRKSNAKKPFKLDLFPHKEGIKICNDKVDAVLPSYIQNPPIPLITEMHDGILIRSVSLREMADRILRIDGEIIKLEWSNSEFKISSLTHESPIYKIKTAPNGEINGDIGNHTLCFKQMLLISSLLSSELWPADLRFYPKGAIQISSNANNMSLNCLLTTVGK